VTIIKVKNHQGKKKGRGKKMHPYEINEERSGKKK
jgi:hypothetical protein